MEEMIEEWLKHMKPFLDEMAETNERRHREKVLATLIGPIVDKHQALATYEMIQAYADESFRRDEFNEQFKKGQ